VFKSGFACMAGNSLSMPRMLVQPPPVAKVHFNKKQ